MKSREHWQQFFKPETQTAGDELVDEKNVVLTVTSDTAINGFVRGGGNSKVQFISQSIGAEKFIATCSCSRAAKGVFCKHIWATLLATETKHPDFLDSKSVIELGQPAIKPTTSAFKEKQTEYKNQQSERLRLRNKEMRQAQKALKTKNAKPSKFKVSYSTEVQAALDFFESNGFSLESDLNEESLKEARKVLSRVFHPDKGGTHEESLLLNQHYDTLIEYLGS